MITSINSGTFQPDQDICGTYLYSEPSAKRVKSKTSWFETGQIDMADLSVIQGHLPNALKHEKPLRIQVRTLADTGATKPMLSQKLIDGNKYLQSCPTYKIKPRPVTMGDNHNVYVDMCIQFMINIGGHWFKFIAFALDIIEDYDFILGAKAIYELEMDVSYAHMQLTFPLQGIPLKMQ